MANQDRVSNPKGHVHSADCHHGHQCILKMDLIIPAREEAISPVVEAVMAAARETHAADDKELEIETSLREAVANAIKHGCCGDATKSVRCSVAFETTGAILIVVSDPGKGFDPQTIPDPTSEERLFDDHGRGIYLINRLMDEVRFEKNGAEIHMKKY